MNGKYLLLFFMVTSLITMVVHGENPDLFDNSGASEFASRFISIGSFFTKDAELDSKDIVLNSTFQSSLETVTQEQTPNAQPGAGGTSGFFAFLDPIKAVLDFVGILLGLPIIGLMFSFGLPSLVSLTLVGLFYLVYVLSVLEFFRGASF